MRAPTRARVRACLLTTSRGLVGTRCACHAPHRALQINLALLANALVTAELLTKEEAEAELMLYTEASAGEWACSTGRARQRACVSMGHSGMRMADASTPATQGHPIVTTVTHPPWPQVMVREYTAKMQAKLGVRGAYDPTLSQELMKLMYV